VRFAAESGRQWSQVEPRERGRRLRAFAEALREHTDELSLLDALDSGNPWSAMTNDVAWGADMLDLFVEGSSQLDGSAVRASAATCTTPNARRSASSLGSSPSTTLTTTAGDLELRIPKLRTGTFFPSLLERRRRVDQALFAVIMEAYLHGVSTRKVDDLVQALGGASGISKSEVSRICADLDEEVGAFRDRSLTGIAYPYVFLDATNCKTRVNRRVVSRAVVIATVVTADGRREVLGFDVGDSEDGAFWTAFLRSLKARGLGGVQLVISDAHTGLKAAIASVLLGAAWQRCRVHFMRNVLAVVPKGNQEMVAAAIRTIFAQPDADHVTEQFEVIAAMLGKQLPKVEQMLRDARDDLLAFTGFPVSHWKKIWSTNPLERLNKEVKRRTDVVGVFPNPAALLRLAGAVLDEAHDEWQVTAERR
jgi:putative transposase